MRSAARRGASLLATAAAFATTVLVATVLAPPSALAAGATPHHVGIVIDGDGVACVNWHSGITGDQILNEVARVVYRSDGVIVQIDGRPKSGTADDTHYWSYWHDAGSSWQYSNVGASSYHPQPGVVEGWVYDDGHQNAPPPAEKPAGLYNSLCGEKDRSQPSPSPSRSARSSSSAAPSRTSSAPATHRTAAPRRRAVAPAPTRTAAARASLAAGDPTSGKAQVHPRRARSAEQSTAITSGPRSSRPRSTRGSTVTSTASSGVAGATTTPSTSASPTSLPTLRAQPVAGASDHGSPTPTVIAIAVIAVLMAGGGWLVLRRRRVR